MLNLLTSGRGLHCILSCFLQEQAMGARLQLGAGGAHEPRQGGVAQRRAAPQADAAQRAEQHRRPAHHAVHLRRTASQTVHNTSSQGKKCTYQTQDMRQEITFNG